MQSTFLYKVSILGILFVIVSAFRLATFSPVYAWECGDCGGGCYPLEDSLEKDEYWCARTDSGAKRAVCKEEVKENGNCNCTKGGQPTCSNVAYVCTQGDSCECTPAECPPGNDSNKFMTQETPGGRGRRCADPCNPTTFECEPTFKNAAPTCSIVPSSISMTRTDAPKTFTLTATDPDWGDNVFVRSATVTNNCAKITTVGGSELTGLQSVRPGSDNPNQLSGSLTLQVDPRGMHGVFGGGIGNSVCTGTLVIELLDEDMDLDGPDTSAFPYPKCSIEITVTNEAPTLTDITIRDRDGLNGITDIPEPGDMLDGRSKLYVGSPLIRKPEEEVRASYCSKALNNTLSPIICTPGDETYGASYSRKRNPFVIDFTVSDANGRADIMQAGLWIQQTAVNANQAALPLTQSGDRKSFQAMYSEKENMQVVSGNSRWNFVSRACIGDGCGPKELQSSSKQLFSALGYIPSFADTVTNNGNVKEGKTAWASSKDWQKVGFPDCLDSTAGCLNANVPTTAQSNAPIGTAAVAPNNWANYEWSVAADESHLICYKSNSAVPEVVPLPSSDVCPANCAACARRLGVTTVSGNSNALRFSFEVYMNDRNGGDGMKDGTYAVFLSALDKVSAPLNNVTDKGNDDGWTRFTKSGAVCTGATCPAGEEFTLVFDSTPPDVTVTVAGPTDSDSVTTTVKATDATSAVAGITNRYVGLRGSVDGVPEPSVTWAQKSDGTPFDGALDHVTIIPASPSTQADALAKGIAANSAVVAGACAYDLAGNMKCSGSPETYTFKASWIKTSYGDVYSKGGVSLSLPTDDGTTDETATVSSPYGQQIFTFATGILSLSAASDTGLQGGHKIGSSLFPLGFLRNYRDESSSNIFNIFAYRPSMPGDEYTRLRSLATLNCEVLNTGASTKVCDNSTGTNLNVAPYTIVTLGANTDWSSSVLSCTKVNIIFVNSGKLTLGSISPAVGGGCLFVVNAGASLEIADTSAQGKVAGKLKFDSFEAAIVSAGGNVQVGKSFKSASGSDYLKLNGFIYSSVTAPKFLREVAQVDIPSYPSEWLLYDASLLDSLRPLLGFEKTADLTCGTSNHILCK